MAQQSKITSRPMTKALGTASILSMAIAGASVANAIQTDFGVTYQADAFYVDGDAYGNDGSGNGLANLLRLKADFKDENTGVSLHTSIQLAGDTWTGDTRDDAGPGYSSQGNESVTLDTGYVQIPVGGNLIRAGRQAASWNNCLLVCDDRRDRISFLAPTSIGTWVALYDRRLDVLGTPNGVFDSNDSGDMFSGGLITRLGGMNVGLLYVHFFKNSEDAIYPFQNVHIFSPYISGSITDGVNFATGMNYVWGNEDSDGDSPFGDGTVSGLDFGAGYSGYARLHGNAGMLDWGVQYVGAIDGGLVDPGFDTYSSLLNSNPASTQNPTSLASMGRGFGMEEYDEHLVIGKLGFNVTPKLKLTGAVGWFSADIGQMDVDDTSMIYDISANYQVNDAVSTVASLGIMTENEAGVSGGGNNMYTTGAATDFDDEDLMAANVGLRVKF
ncbi:hypothetical protein ACFOZ5_17510 [Marinobacter lacisalsi]|uniref:Uncharacterized protein n=1 Tax=Marinobacter lacisalsi TaxID=475979 RepID=A0ABV8QN46_9GAMM